jgi:lambda family phage portal protein
MAKMIPAPRRAVQVEMNLLDQAINWFAPRVAQRRLIARTAVALMGGYHGARRDRASTASWHPGAGSPDTDVIADLPMLRERSRDAERNQPVAAGVVNTTTVHAVGTGLSCNPRINAEFLKLDSAAAEAWQKDTRHRYNTWAGSKDCSLARDQNFYEQQDLALRTTLSSGDSFVVTPIVERGGYARLALQILEADRVGNPGSGASNTDTLTDGVECSPDTGEAIAYHVCNRHPGDMRGARTWQRIEARGAKTGRRNVLHLYRVIRPGLRRGVPILAPVLEPLRQIANFTKAELDAAVNSALFPLFATMDPKAFDETFSEQDISTIVERSQKWSGEIESGKVMNLLPGETVESPAPGRPNPEFDPFFNACLSQIGLAIGLPKEVLAMHFQSSYSAARGALLMAWKFFMGWRDWLATNLCQPVYELWLADEVAAGRISAPGFFADEAVRSAWCGAQWVGDGPGSLDPQKEVGAAEKRVALGISTLQAESQLYDGVDWETKHAQQVKEREARKRDGLHAEPVPAAAAPVPQEDDEPQAPPAPPARKRG